MLTVLPELLRGAAEYKDFLTGLLLLLLLFFCRRRGRDWFGIDPTLPRAT